MGFGPLYLLPALISGSSFLLDFSQIFLKKQKGSAFTIDREAYFSSELDMGI